MPSSLTFSVFDAALMTPAEPRASTALLAFSPVDAERAAVPDRGAVSFTTVYSASVMSSRLPQRLTTPCEPVLRDAPVLDDAVEVLRVGPLGAAELLDADGAGVSCCGATPCPLAFSRRGWLPPPLRPPPPLPVGPLGPLRLETHRRATRWGRIFPIAHASAR